jgi:hypothetical protein
MPHLFFPGHRLVGPLRCLSQFFVEEINTRLESKTVRIVQRVIVGLSSEADQAGAEIHEAVVAAPPADNVGCSPEIPAVGVEESSEDPIECDDLRGRQRLQFLLQDFRLVRLLLPRLRVGRFHQIPERRLVHDQPPMSKGGLSCSDATC